MAAAAAKLSATLCLAAAVVICFLESESRPSARLGMVVPPAGLIGELGATRGRLIGRQRLRMLAACAALAPEVNTFEVKPASHAL